MKQYIFTNPDFFKKNYEQFFAMRVFHREENGQLIIKFATKSIEKYFLNTPIIKEQLQEINE